MNASRFQTPTLFDQMIRQIMEQLAPVTELDILRDWLEALRDGQDLSSEMVAWLQTTGITLLTSTNLPVKARAALGQVLGVLDLDSRPGVGLRPDGLPDVGWCEVPAGAFLMGSDKRRDPFAYRVELPQRQITLDAFQIAQYPITFSQFQTFANAPAYTDPAWWAVDRMELDTGLDLAAIQKLDAQAFPYTTHPRDSVSWDQAAAFCRWLTAQHHATGLINEDQEIRLPTEQEWEKAARGTEGNVYPYGDDFDEHKANISDTRLKQTSTVGIFPDGASPYGALDMSGNIYEWTSPVQATASDDPEIRILKGGSFFLSAEWSRCAHRYERSAATRLNDVGFRVVLSASSIR